MTNWPGGHRGYGGPNPIGGPHPVGPDEPTLHGPANRPWGRPPAQQSWPPQPAPAWPQHPSGPPPNPPGQPAPWGAGPPTGQPPFGPPPPRNRKPLIITLCAGGAVVLAVVVVAVIALAGGGGGGRGGSAGDAVKGYLEALARGDADTALSYSNDQPGSKEFLTDEILKKQVDRMPITNIKILGDDSVSGGGLGTGSVHVSANFGDKVSDANIEVKKSGSAWKLANAAVKLDQRKFSTNDKALDTLTLFGKSLGDSTVYVFPGWLDVGSSNTNLKVKSQPILLDGLAYASLSVLNVDFELSDSGTEAVRKAIKDAAAKCAQSHSLNPDGCPQHVYEYDAVDDTAAWGVPDISPIKIEQFSRYDMTARFNGNVEWPVTVGMRGGGTRAGTVTTLVYGQADLTKNPPEASFH